MRGEAWIAGLGGWITGLEGGFVRAEGRRAELEGKIIGHGGRMEEMEVRKAGWEAE